MCLIVYTKQYNKVCFFEHNVSIYLPFIYHQAKVCCKGEGVLFWILDLYVPFVLSETEGEWLDR